MKLLVPPTLAAIALATLLVGCSGLNPRASDERAGTVGLNDGARSVEELLEEFVVAIRENDPNALRKLRVDQNQYINVIIPGSVQPNEPPKEYAADFTEFLWGSLDQKNRYAERDLLTSWGGKTLSVENASFIRGVRAYRGYTAYSKLDLTLRDDHGEEVRFEMGSIAQVADRYKFVSFTRD